MSYSKIGEAIDSMYRVGIVTLAISVPLALWKLFDIAYWVYKNVSISVGLVN